MKIGRTDWRNAPPFHETRGDALVVRTGHETDFWNNTFYGFHHDNGHFRGTEVTGDFSLEITFNASYGDLYDQAGAMLFVDGKNWLKCGVEYTDGAKQFSVVVTRDDQSDWSVAKIDGELGDPVSLRMTRHAEALRIQRQERDGTWVLARLCYLQMPETVTAGPMCCSPVGRDLEVTFSRIAFGEPISRDLH